MNTAEAIIIANAALTRTGHNEITDFEDGSDEAVLMNANYEEVVKAELASFPWSWAKTDEELNRLNINAIDEWAYVYELPVTVVKLVRVHVDGRGIEYKKKGDKIYCDEIENVSAEFIYRADEDDWSHDFRGNIIRRLEALVLRGLDENYDAAELRERSAEDNGSFTKSRDGQNRTPKDRRRVSRLVAIRRG